MSKSKEVQTSNRMRNDFLGSGSQFSSHNGHSFQHAATHNDEDTEITRTTETRPVRSYNITSPTKINPVVTLTSGNNLRSVSPFAVQGRFNDSYRHSVQSRPVLSARSSEVGTFGAIRPMGNHLIQRPKMMNIGGVFRVGEVVHTKIPKETVDYVTKETITTKKRKSKNQSSDSQILLKTENSRLMRKITELESTIDKLRNENTKIYVLEKENENIKDKNSRLHDEISKLKSRNEDLRLNLIMAQKQGTPKNKKSEEKWAFFQKEIDRMGRELSISAQAKRELETDNLELKTRNIRLDTDNQQKEFTIDDLKHRINNLNQENEQMRVLISDKGNQISIMHTRIDDTQKLMENMKNNANDSFLDRRVEALQSQLELVKGMLESEKEKNSQYVKQLTEAAAQIQIGIHMEDENKRMAGELDTLRGEVDDLRRRINNQNGEKIGLISRINSLERVKPENPELLSALKSEIKNLNHKINEYENNIAQLENLVDELQSANKDLQDQLERLNSDYQLLEREYNNQNSSNSNEETMMMLKNDNDNLKNLNSKLQEQLKNAIQNQAPSEEFNELFRKIGDLESKLTKDTNSSNDLKKRIRELKAKLKYYEKKENRWRDLQNDLKKIREELDKDKNEIERLREDKSDLEDKLTKKNKTVDDLEKTIESLKTELNQLQNRYEHLEKTMEFSQNENNDIKYIEEIEGLRQMIQEKEEELKLWQSEVARLEQEIGSNEESDDRIEELRNRISALEEENTELSQQFESFKEEASSREDELSQESENLRELLRQLREKLEVQLDTNQTIAERARLELELKEKLREELSLKIQMIMNQASGETSESAQYYQQEIAKLHTENERVIEEYKRLEVRIEEMKRELELLREEVGGVVYTGGRVMEGGLLEHAA